MKHIAAALAALLLAACAQPQPLQAQTPIIGGYESFRDGCLGNINSPGFNECMAYVVGFVQGYHADNPAGRNVESRSFCIPSDESGTAIMTKFLRQLEQPSGAEKAMISARNHTPQIATYSAFKRAYPCR